MADKKEERPAGFYQLARPYIDIRGVRYEAGAQCAFAADMAPRKAEFMGATRKKKPSEAELQRASDEITMAELSDQKVADAKGL